MVLISDGSGGSGGADGVSPPAGLPHSALSAAAGCRLRPAAVGGHLAAAAAHHGAQHGSTHTGSTGTTSTPGTGTTAALTAPRHVLRV